MPTHSVKSRRLVKHVRRAVLSGLFVLVPVWITIAVGHAVVAAMAALLKPAFDGLFPGLSDIAAVLLSVAAFLILVYVIGVMTRFVIGRRMVSAAESVVLHIPVVKSVYAAAKQIVDSLSFSRRFSFKSVVLVEFPRPGLKAIGFVTGTCRDSSGNEYCAVFIPTAPNPTSGFLELVPPESVTSTTLTTEEAIKMVISVGALSPEFLRTEPFKQCPQARQADAAEE